MPTSLTSPPPDATSPYRVTGAWVVRPRQDPIKNGSVVIGANGRIEWVGSADDVPFTAQLPEWRIETGILTPGFINTHTHLELSHLSGAIRAPDFPRWLAQVRTLKEATTPEEFFAASCLGIMDMWSQGVTTVGDAGSTGASARALAALGASGVYFQEVFGPDPADTNAALGALDRELALLDDATSESERTCVGVSPHAPYTVNEELTFEVFTRAAADGRPVAMHTAESHEERLFVRDGTGLFASWHQARGITVKARARSTIQWLYDLGILRYQPLCVHCVTVSDDDIALLAESDAPVAHCPLSNEAHAHGSAPIASMFAAGVRVGLGTDSVVSRSPLDLRAEARKTGLSRPDQLSMLTNVGASALGLDARCGDLQVGHFADVVLLDTGTPNPEPSDWADATVAGTIVGGTLVYHTGKAVDARRSEWERICGGARIRLLRP